METPAALGIIAGNGVYPRVMAEGARKAGVSRIVVAAFTGETEPSIEQHADAVEWMRVGQLGRLLKFFRANEIRHGVMAGQIQPRHLFDLRADMKTLLLLARLRQRNAETIFGAVADELSAIGIELLPAYTFLEDQLAGEGLIAGRQLRRREEEDVAFGMKIAREISRLDIGQTVVVRNGTVLAVEAFEGTNDAMKRGGALGRDGAVVVKVSKPNQDMRFDVPVIGPATIAMAKEARIRVIAVEAGRTLLLEKEELVGAAESARVSVVGRALAG